jgi:ATP-binding protein involved in chromosome partitioning
MSKERVLKALSTVEEPDLKKDLVSLGMVKDVNVEGSNVSFTIVLTTPACPLKELIRTRCTDAVKAELGNEVHVTVNLTADVTSTRSGPLLPGV